jgi:hypothetical protein
VRSWTGEHEFEFVSSSVGRNHQITCVTGEILRRVEPRFGNEVYDDLCFSFPVRTPANSLVFDILIHRDLFPTNEPLKPNLYSDLFGGGPGFYYEESDRLPLHESMQYLGEGNSVSTPDIPRYSEMLSLAFSRSGFAADEFNAYRLRVEYPTISTTLLVGRKLPRRTIP